MLPAAFVLSPSRAGETPAARKTTKKTTTTTTTTTRSSSSSRYDENPNLAADVRVKVNKHAAKVMKEKFEKSSLRDECHYLPQFSLDEIVKGKVLGKGFFGMVYEVREFNIHDGGGGGGGAVGRIKASTTATAEPSVTKSFSKGRARRRRFLKRLFFLSSSSKNDYSDEELEEFEPRITSQEGGGGGGLDNTNTSIPNSNNNSSKVIPTSGRIFMAQHCLRGSNGQARYAIKVLRNEIINDPKRSYYQGIMDINSEAKLLSAIRHTNIIKLRAIATSSTFASRFQENYFIVLDRLYDVLEDRVHKKWKRRYKQIGGGDRTNLLKKKLFDFKGHKWEKLWEERIVASYDLSSALEYMHEKRVIHRDLKPDNIGFDIRNDIKIFDFGLARELPAQEEATSTDAWKMTGDTGTPRYMAPEIALNQPYGASSDTYSFCMLFWEILAMKLPFELYSMKSFEERVWRGPCKRPPLDASWPTEIRLLLQRGLSASPSDRQPMSIVREILEQQVAACDRHGDGGSPGALERASRRSTFVWEPLERSNSMFSLLSSPFAKKSSFSNPGLSSTLSSSTGKKKKGVLDGTKDTQQMMLTSPSSSSFNSIAQQHLSSSSNGQKMESSAVASSTTTGLPQVPSMFEEDDDSVEESGGDATTTMSANVDPTDTERVRSADGSGNASKLYSVSEAAPPPEGTIEHGTSKKKGEAGVEGNNSLWQKIEAERQRQDNIRARIAAVKAS